MNLCLFIAFICMSCGVNADLPMPRLAGFVMKPRLKNIMPLGGMQKASGIDKIDNFNEEKYGEDDNNWKLSEDKLFSGAETNIEDHPHQVSFQFNTSDFCGGFIVSKDYIITAGHCADNVDPKTVILRAGSTSRKHGTIIQIAKLIVHPDYNNPPKDKDVAIMKTAEPIKFTETIKPIPLQKKGKSPKPGSEVDVSGWGETETGHFPELLMAVTIPVVPRVACRASYTNSFTRNMFCAGHYLMGGADTCQNDSGDAAVQDGIAVGIVPYGRIACGNPLYLPVFADLGALVIRDFIVKHIGL